MCGRIALVSGWNPFCTDVLEPRTLGARVARVLPAVRAGLGVAQRAQELEVLDSVVCAIPVLVLELQRDGLVHPRDDAVALDEVHVLALVALVRPVQVVDETVLERHVVEVALLNEDLLGRFLEAAASRCEVARVEGEQGGAAHALGLLVLEVVVVSAFLHEVGPAAAGAHQCPEALVVDRVQLRGGARLHAGGRLADFEVNDGQSHVLDPLRAVRARMPAAVAVVALAHELRELGALAHKVPESVVRDVRTRVARREVARVQTQAQHLLLQGQRAATAAEAPELERVAAAARKVIPAVAEAHEVGELLGGNVVHRVVGVQYTRM